MPITEETLRLADELRIMLDRHVDDATRDLVRAWALTWDTVVADWRLAFAQIETARAAGLEPTRTQLLRAERTQLAIATTQRAIEDLARKAELRIVQPVADIVDQAAAQQRPILTSQLPSGTAAAGLRGSLVRVDQRQLEAIVARTTQRVTSLATKLTPLGMRAVNAELVRAVAQGLGARDAARRMVTSTSLANGMERAFTLPLNRAMNITRTELLDAHRAGAAAGQAANKDVLRGWIWKANLDQRTCPSCWAQHGTEHPVDEPGPYDHQQGRCQRLPQTKSWAELGFEGIEEPPSLIPDARETFNRLDPEQQLAIMGRSRLDALNDGRISWADLSTRRKTAQWRDSYVPISAGTAARR